MAIEGKDPIRIAASLMCCDLLHLQEEVVKLEAAGVDWLHIDVMDGCFVPNFAMSCREVELLRGATRLPLDVHLMIEHPEGFIDHFSRAGADLITVHVEACRHVHRTLQLIRSTGAKAGLAVNPGTPMEMLREVLDTLDLILIMAVDPGFAGQKFLPATISKVRRTKEWLDAMGYGHISLEVDGAIDTGTIPPLYAAGARIFVGGTAGLFRKDRNFAAAMDRLRRCIATGRTSQPGE